MKKGDSVGDLVVSLRKMKDKTQTVLLLHLAVFLAGWTGVFGRIISLGGLPLVWYRIMVSIVAMALVMACSRRFHRSSRKAVLKSAGCGVLLAFHWVAFYESIQASNVSIGVACIATSCFFTTLFDPLINRHKVSFKDVLISFIAISGILLIFSLDVRYRTGIAWGLLSAAIYSVFAILNVNVARETGEDTSTMLFYELIGGIIILTVCMMFYGTAHQGIPVPGRGDLVSLLVLGSVLTIIPFLLQIHALRKLSAFTVNVTYNLEPIYSIIFAAFLFGETREVGLSFWLGISLVVISVVLQTYRVRH